MLTVGKNCYYKEFLIIEFAQMLAAQIEAIS